MTVFPRSEVESELKRFIAVGDSADWDAWADLHSEDGLWVEHHLGTFRGREAIRQAIVGVMAQAPPMSFPVEWSVVDGNRAVFYPWQVFPDPSGGDEVFRFGCVTVLEYAGGGLWSYQEDVYNPREAEQVMKRWVTAGGRLPGT